MEASPLRTIETVTLSELTQRRKEHCLLRTALFPSRITATQHIGKVKPNPGGPTRATPLPWSDQAWISNHRGNWGPFFTVSFLQAGWTKQLISTLIITVNKHSCIGCPHPPCLQFPTVIAYFYFSCLSHFETSKTIFLWIQKISWMQSHYSLILYFHLLWEFRDNHLDNFMLPYKENPRFNILLIMQNLYYNFII